MKTAILLLSVILTAKCQSGEENKNLQPLFIPGKCDDNQLYYPPQGKEKEWVCDCAPGFIYDDTTEKCYEAFTKGPCKSGQLFVLFDTNPDADLKPKCIKNRCNKDTEVRYQGQCWELHKPGGPCRKVEDGGGILGVNVTSLLLECIKSDDVGLSIIVAPTRTPSCNPGSKRFGKKCRPVYHRNQF